MKDKNFTKQVIIMKKIISIFLHISITDQGCGIDDVEQAVTPFFTTLESEERSGMGFTIMQTFMDDFKLESERGKGTKVFMTRKIGFEENGEIRKRADA